MKKGFYKTFEERNRGSRELIKSRFRIYLPFIVPFKKKGAVDRVYDIGCGRGEWLELLVESGFDAYGMDLDEGMLDACYLNSLPAEEGDAVDHLFKLKDDSHAVISAFHVAEHMSHEALHTVVREALRILIPGGLLILETPNPENINVATKNFYLDPTHQRPIPPELMSFLPEYYGFKRVKVLRLNESRNLTENDSQNLYNVINGVSPDYSVIAQKAAPKKIMAMFDQAFNKEYGVTLENLAGMYDKSILSREKKIEEKAMSAEVRAKIAETRAVSAEADALAAENRAQKAEAMAVSAEARALAAENRAQKAEAMAVSAEDRALAAENRAQKAEAMAVSAEDHSRQAENGVKEALNLLLSVYASWSWRFTAPARWLAGLVIAGFKLLKNHSVHVIESGIRAVQGPLAWLMRFVISHPNLSSRLNRRLLNHPWLYHHLLDVARETRILTYDSTGKVFQQFNSDMTASQTFSQLTPRARQIYNDLKAAMGQRNEERN